ncbi:23S rRNA pseudouridylate synthase B, partial [Vibrio cholerae]|nr:23S rRNA pseudouridylate synthase B [Vibrio cholerae]
RKRERTRSQKIRRAVRRHEERISTPAGRSGKAPARRKPGSGESSTRNKVANQQQSSRKPRG